MGASDAVPKAVAKVGKAGASADYSRGDHQHSLDPNLFTEQVNVQLEGVDKGSRQGVNFRAGANITLNVAEDAPNERVNVEIASAGGGGTPESVLMGAMFMSLGGLDVYSVGGTVTKYSWGAKIETAAATPYKGYAHYQYLNIDSVTLFDKNPQFELYFRYTHVTADDDKFIIVGGTAGAPTTVADKKFGVYIANSTGELKIVSSDGAAQTYSVALMTMLQNTWYRIRCKLTSASQVEVWVDGVSKGTKTTNLPSGVLPANKSCPQLYAVSVAYEATTMYYAGLKVMHDY